MQPYYQNLPAVNSLPTQFKENLCPKLESDYKLYEYLEGQDTIDRPTRFI
jgi:hypothetical protein